jgi:integrase
MQKPTDAFVRTRLPGKYCLGDGLWLTVRASGSRSWSLRVMRHGTLQELGLGGYKTVSLADARRKAAELRAKVKDDVNVRAERLALRAKAVTFKEAMERCHDANEAGWSTKQAKSFKSTLTTYVVRHIGFMPVAEIHAPHIADVLQRKGLWTDKPELARKVQQRILKVLSFAKGMGWRDSELPETKAITAVLPKRKSGNKHFASMPFSEVPAFVASQLKAMDDGKGVTSARLALLFTILTAARSGEVRHARWEHIDRSKRSWDRPAAMMKMRKDHDVMLSEAALAILDKAEKLSIGDGLIFPSARRDSPLSDQTLSSMMRRAGLEYTVHGFRSSFKDWSMEKTDVPWFVSEMALAHSPGSATERAYARSSLRELRLNLAEAWGRFVAPSLSIDGDNVVELRPAAAAS